MASRLMAVQAMHQAMQLRLKPEQLGQDFHVEPLLSENQKRGIEGDKTFFDTLLRLFRETSLAHLDSAIDASLTYPWQPDRLEPLLLAILRIAAAELMCVEEVKAHFVIGAYVMLAHSFFGGSEPGFVRAVLGKLAAQMEEKTTSS
jgi:N utilization substance protein B